MLCYLRALLFKNSWYHYVILQRWGEVAIRQTDSTYMKGGDYLEVVPDAKSKLLSAAID